SGNKEVCCKHKGRHREEHETFEHNEGCVTKGPAPPNRSLDHESKLNTARILTATKRMGRSVMHHTEPRVGMGSIPPWRVANFSNHRKALRIDWELPAC